MGAMTAAFAITAALYRKQQFGEGAFIDVSMLDATLTTMASWVISNHLNADNEPQRLGNESHSAAPSGTFPTKDGQINIVNNEQKQFDSLCDVIGRTDLKTNPLFADRDERFKNKDLLRAELVPVLESKTGAEWEDAFAAAGIPAGRIYTIPEILRHPHIKARNIMNHFDDVPGTDSGATVAGLGFKFVGEDMSEKIPPPRLGQDTDAILAGIGLDEEEIQQLRDEGTV